MHHAQTEGAHDEAWCNADQEGHDAYRDEPAPLPGEPTADQRQCDTRDQQAFPAKPVDDG
jgi:hypothetical protein